MNTKKQGKAKESKTENQGSQARQPVKKKHLNTPHFALS